MTLMMTLTDGSPVQLGAKLAHAGEGAVYLVDDHPEWVAKVFHPDLKDRWAKLAKITAMAASPPLGAVQSDGFVVLTWPQHVLHGDGGPCGYLMSRIDTTNAVELHVVANPSARADPPPGVPAWPTKITWRHLVMIAVNLCHAVDVVHRSGAVIGDFQERNILVSDTARVTLVDCDSVQVASAGGHQFFCTVTRPEFTAPELAGADLHTHVREQSSDLFALAVLIHQLLMGGNHPFLRGNWTGAGEQPDALTLAKSGSWAGAPGSPLVTHPLAPPASFLPLAIQTLFARALQDGAYDPATRPTASEWGTALARVETARCRSGAHEIPTGCYPCPWCNIAEERKARRTRARGVPPPDQTADEAASTKTTQQTAGSAGTVPNSGSTPPPSRPTESAQRRVPRLGARGYVTPGTTAALALITSVWPGVLAIALLHHAFGKTFALGTFLPYFVAAVLMAATMMTLAIGSLRYVRRGGRDGRAVLSGCAAMIFFSVFVVFVAFRGSSNLQYLATLFIPTPGADIAAWGIFGIGLPTITATFVRTT